jgi:signal peptidase I
MNEKIGMSANPNSYKASRMGNIIYLARVRNPMYADETPRIDKRVFLAKVKEKEGMDAASGAGGSGKVIRDGPAKTRPEARSRGRPPSVLRELLALLAKIALICGIALLAFTFIYGLYRSADPDMTPAVKDGDVVMYYRLDKEYAAGDLIVLDYEGERQVRRVVAIAGDTVDVTEDGLLINGALQQEFEIYERTARYAEGIDFPVTVDEGAVFVLGDSRENATDSRIYGAVDAKDTQGTAIAIARRRGL